MRIIVLGGNYQTTSLFVEPVDNSWPFYAAYTREAITAMAEQRIHQRTAAIPGGRMDNKAGGFVNYNQIIIFVNNI